MKGKRSRSGVRRPWTGGKTTLFLLARPTVCNIFSSIFPSDENDVLEIDNSNEIRLYPRSENLDNRHMSMREFQRPVLFLNVYRDYLLVFSATKFASVFQLIETPKSLSNILTLISGKFFILGVEMTLLWELDLSTRIVSVLNMISMSLSPFSEEMSDAHFDSS